MADDYAASTATTGVAQQAERRRTGHQSLLPGLSQTSLPRF
jgi:hypothetical protein